MCVDKPVLFYVLVNQAAVSPYHPSNRHSNLKLYLQYPESSAAMTGCETHASQLTGNVEMELLLLKLSEADEQIVYRV